MALHFNSGPHSLADMSVMVIERARSQDPRLHRTMDSQWIRTLGILFPLGMRGLTSSPVSLHFNSGPHSLADMSVMVFESAHSQDHCLRRTMDSQWIRTLGTSFPLGMNLRDDSL